MSKPMLFKAPMVRAILDGRKTQTRRLVQPQYAEIEWRDLHRGYFGTMHTGREQHWERVKCPYPVGTRIWVRETWAVIDYYDRRKPSEVPEVNVVYRAGGPDLNGQDRQTFEIDERGKWRRSIHMPKHAARIWLEVTRARIERLRDIPEEDAIAEGIDGVRLDGLMEMTPLGMRPETGWMNYSGGDGFNRAARSFSTLWESINGAGSWAANPWVWVYEFEIAEGGAE